MKEIKYDINRWRDIAHFGVGTINTVKMTTLPNAIYRCNVILTKLPQHFSQTRTKNLRFVWRHERPQVSKTILRKKNGAGGIRLPDFRLHCNATVIKAAWHWNKNRSIEQWNRIESPKIIPHIYGHLIYDKGNKNIQWR